jgi:uncharacterized membrane protein YphA (DoxX/SURF4 family)/thiol-disulfide isomerase/thioredoxin
MNKRIEIYALFAGLIFLLSGIAKALNISVFSNVITQYGFENLQFIAPIIVLAEVFLGLLLVFQIWTKCTAFVSGLMLIAFTIIYAYGFIFKGIEDCGCFGKIAFLNTSPVFTFLRNAALLYLLIAVWRKAKNTAKMNMQIIAVVITVLCVVTFMSGYGFRFANKMQSNKKVVAIENSGLNEFVETSKDSTYLVFAFTYTCPHCMNSIENLKQYESFGVVDKVIGLALEDSVAEQEFKKIFKPDFSIQNYPAKKFFRLTNSFPVAYYIKNDSVIRKFSGELPCAYVMQTIMREIP